jgi:pentatricopeptide repeat domain-containing protein 1
VDRALSILNTMEQKGLQPNVRTYNSVIDCIAQHGDNPEQAEAIVDRMTKAGVDPNVVTYSAVINGTCSCHHCQYASRDFYSLVCLTFSF